MPRRVVAVVVGLAVVFATLPALSSPVEAQPRKPRPDLVVTSVSALPATVTAGTPSTVTVRVKNVGKAKAARSTTTLYLSRTARVDRRSVRLGTAATASLAPRKAKRLTLRFAMPAAPLDVALRLIACADTARKVREAKEGNNCRVAGRPITIRPRPPRPDSTTLIQQAVERGELSVGTGLLYLGYSATGDKRLPAAYRSSVTTFDSNEELTAIAAGIGSQSPAVQAKLDPFLSPPRYVGAYVPGGTSLRMRAGRAERSACAFSGLGGERPPAGDWASTVTEHFRIWSYTKAPNEDVGPPSASAAGAAKIAAIAENVYAKETALWRAPLSDASVKCNGGDGKIDVYIIRNSNGKTAQAVPYGPGEINRPGWMWIAPDKLGTAKDARDIFAHEFAHLTQLAYDYRGRPTAETAYLNLEYGWLEEASATWAIDHVYAEDNYEHRFLNDYFDGQAWDAELGKCAAIGCKNGYRDYLFFSYATRKAGSAALMSTLWTATESHLSIESVDLALGFDFAGAWKEFMLYNLNVADYDYYTKWDKITHQLPVGEGANHRTVKLTNGRTTRTTLDTNSDVKQTFAQQYHWQSFELDDAVREFTFRDPGFNKNDPVEVDATATAYYSLADGTTHTEDWTELQQKVFCRDKPAEDITELVLFWNNGKPQTYLTFADRSDPRAPGLEAEIVAAPECTPRYAVHVEYTKDLPLDYPTESYTFDAVIDRPDPNTPSCGTGCKNLEGVGTWSGERLEGTCDDPDLVARSGRTEIYASYEDHGDPPPDIDGDGRVGDELFFIGTMFTEDDNGAFFFATPSGFFPRAGGTFTTSEMVPGCLFGEKDSLETFTYTITRLN